LIISDLPALNAGLNTLSVALLLRGYLQIRRGEREAHRKTMLAALVSSGLFLSSYLVYHFQVGSVPYPHHDWTRPLYFAVLIPHVILAALLVPLVVVLVWRALKGEFARHRRLARWVWPVWIFVSLSGVVVYLMLYRL
jgi:putative membrane protein